MKENKYIRVIICLAMSLCMLFTTTKVAYASNLDNSFTKIDDLEKTRYHKIRQYVENFLSMNMCEQKIVDSYPLYDLNNKMIAVLFNLEIGYIIINIKDFSIPEFTFERKSIYSPNSQKKFYNGAFEYFENIDDNYMKNLYDNKKVDIKNFDRSNLYGEDSVYTKSLPMSTTSSTKLTATCSRSDYLRHPLPNYSYNPNGICGANAAAMYLRYLDLYRKTNIIPSYLTTEKMIIKTLATYIPAYSNSGNIYSGMMKYLSSQNVSLQFYLSTTNINDIVRCISTDTPFIAGFIASSSLSAHWATGYGYKEYSNGNVYLIINDGHGNTGVSMDISQSDMIIG